MFDGNRYISDTDLARRLCVSKQTLANYRASSKMRLCRNELHFNSFVFNFWGAVQF